MGKLWEPGERYNLSRNYNRRSKPLLEKYRNNRTLKKTLWQVAASLVIFILIWGIFQFEHPLMQPVQGKIRSWFTEDYNIEPVIKFFSEVGLWGDTLERAAFETVKYPQASSSLRSLIVPVSGQVTRPFGWILTSDQKQTFHDGIVIVAPEGTPIKAALAGEVTRIANEEEKGRIIEIKSQEGVVTTYGHCKEILVNLNDKISAGQVIGKVGKSGRASHPQLYFRVMKNGEPLDPAALFITTGEKV